MYKNNSYASEIDKIFENAHTEGIDVSDLRSAKEGEVYNLAVAPTDLRPAKVEGARMGFIAIGELTLNKLVVNDECLNAYKEANGNNEPKNLVKASSRGKLGLKKFVQQNADHFNEFGEAQVKCVFTRERDTKNTAGDDIKVTDALFVWMA